MSPAVLFSFPPAANIQVLGAVRILDSPYLVLPKTANLHHIPIT